MKRFIQIVIVLALIAAGVLLWRQVFPSPEVKIRKRLSRLQELVSFSGNEGNLSKVAASRELAGLFTKDAEIRVNIQGGPRGTISGRESIMEKSLGARQILGGLKVELLDISVVVNEDGTTAVAEATGKAIPTGSDELWVQELRFQFIETEDGWMIKSVETIRTLTRRTLEAQNPAVMLRAA